MAFFTPATSLEARDASERTTAIAAAAAAQRGVMKLLSPNIVVVGCINEDTIIDVERLPAPGETVLGREVRTTYGGKGANQAVQAALLMPGVVQAAEVQQGQQPSSSAAKKREDREQLGGEEEEGKKEEDTEMGAAAAAVATIKEKVAAATEKAAEKVKTTGEEMTSAVEGWLSQLSSTAQKEVAERGKDLLLEKGTPGEKVALICKLGEDEAGMRYKRYLGDLNIHPEGIFTAVKGKPTGRAFITVSIQENGENAIAYVPGANEHLTPSDIQQPHIVSLLQQAKVVVCENGVSAAVTAEALRLAKSAADDITTIFTPSPVAHVPREAFAYADYIILNALEAQQLYEQLVPLPRVRDSAGHVYEERQQEQQLKSKEKEWPSLYATAPDKTAKHQRAGRGGGRPHDTSRSSSSATAAAAASDTEMPPPLALRERLRAVGTHAVEISPAAAPTWRHPGGISAKKTEMTSLATTPARETEEEAAPAAALSPVTAVPSGGGDAPSTAAAADIEAAAAKTEREVTKTHTEEAETTAEQSPTQLHIHAKQPRRGKCDIIITTGATGCTITHETQVVHVSPRREVQPHEVVDTVGAGDAFVGALAYFLAHDKTNVEEAVAKAGVIASYSIQRKGASVSYATRQTLGEDFFKP